MKNIKILFTLFCMNGVIFSSHEVTRFNYNTEGDEYKSLSDIQKERRQRLSQEAKDAEMQEAQEAQARIDRQNRKKQKEVSRQAAEKGNQISARNTHVPNPKDVGFKMDFTKEEEKEAAEQAARETQEKEAQKRARQQAEQARMKKEADNIAQSKLEGFDFTDDENEPKMVKPADPKDVSTWTEKNISTVNLKEIASLKTEELKKLLKNQKLLEKLPKDLVQAIQPDELAKIIDGHFGTRIMQWTGKGIVTLPESFVKKMSSAQARAIVENEATKGTFTVSHYKDYFSEKSRIQLEKLAKSFKDTDVTKAERDALKKAEENSTKRVSRKLTPEQVEQLKQEVLGLDFSTMTPEKIRSVDPELFKYVTLDQVLKMTKVSVDAMSFEQLEKLISSGHFNDKNMAIEDKKIGITKFDLQNNDAEKGNNIKLKNKIDKNILRYIEGRYQNAIDSAVKITEKTFLLKSHQLIIDQIVGIENYQDIEQFGYKELHQIQAVMPEFSKLVKDLKLQGYHTLSDSLVKKIKLIEKRVESLHKKIQEVEKLTAKQINQMSKEQLKSYADVMDGLRKGTRALINEAFKKKESFDKASF